MPVTHLAAAALLLCSPLAFGQNQQGHAYTDVLAPPYSISYFESLHDFNRSEVAPSEPSWIALKRPQNASQAKVPSLPVPVTPDGALAVDHSGQNSPTSIKAGSPNKKIQELESEDTICYSIRSYVVARDEKDSDSTHPVGSSTCQPVSRYGLRSADLQPNSHDR